MLCATAAALEERFGVTFTEYADLTVAQNVDLARWMLEVLSEIEVDAGFPAEVEEMSYDLECDIEDFVMLCRPRAILDPERRVL